MATDRTRRHLTAVALAAVLLTSCGGDISPDEAADLGTATTEDETSAEEDPPSDAEAGIEAQRFPDVIAAELERQGDAWRLDATLSSPYDTPDRYADAFRALSEHGTELGIRELAHDHANEQPFTRSLTGLDIPDDVARITVEGRDQEYGWGGDTVEIQVPSRSGAGD